MTGAELSEAPATNLNSLPTFVFQFYRRNLMFLRFQRLKSDVFQRIYMGEVDYIAYGLYIYSNMSPETVTDSRCSSHFPLTSAQSDWLTQHT
jgi:hypothetical protein